MGKRSELTPFGRQVKIRLLERGMDASELARRVGTSPVQISRMWLQSVPLRMQAGCALCWTARRTLSSSEAVFWA